MKKTILLYSLALAILLGLLKAVEYRFLLRDLSTELYVSIVALFFSALGIWAGLKLTRRFNPAVSTDGTVPQPPVRLEPIQLLEKYNLSKREYEVLTLIAQGYSNQEIAETLFVSLNTIKTHSSNVFLKLDVKRRTQAVQKAKEIGLL
ncbi:response regulator transcription factor [Haliscomenobacter hydrossis]|uniref:ATP-dependent transcriptional regulator, MalT-like, LuxR family n=1 Tax=Haliscomenobacter hydrossis (strain ATCC 27775 / DSM 1100 / LMG 10767 / O) TaxID=760192 RepID=F4KXB1_HALH1|nr:LuxR C-terminal-related transcriptional regulator [Haliscomenobacter hydrossis]AEE49319.1 ATP-dependent transcriptional regulator, MalT-like, LuxR family [Haliscomenobacter hydrossis DSM 1100]